MDLNGWITLIGPVLVYGLTQLFKKNPSLKAHAPLIVTILSAVSGFIQSAATASAAGVDSLAVVPHPHTVAGTFFSYFLANMNGSIIIDNLLSKFIGKYVIGTLAKGLK